MVFLFSVFVLLANAQGVSAKEDPDDPFAGIEEMVVTGTSASLLLQSQEVSVVGFNADYLEALGASDLGDIAQFTPNLEIRSPFAASNPTLFIRGVGLRDFNANSSSSVAVYNDDIYMNSPAGQLAQLFDVENVDVLRGPQGGIYGRNASAGAIRVISRKPTGTAGGYVNVTYGRFDQVEVETAAETPIIDDRLALRIAGKMNRRGGTTRNRCGEGRFASDPGENPLTSFRQRVHDQCFNATTVAPVPDFFGVGGWTRGVRAPVKDRVNDVNNWAMRAVLKWTPEYLDDMSWTFNVHAGQNRGDSRQFQLIGAEQGQLALEPEITRSIATRDRDGYIDPDNQFRAGPSLQLNGIPRSPFRGDPFAGDYNNVQKELLDLVGGNIVGDFSIGDFSFKTITGYEWNKRDVELNLDGGPFRTLEPNLRNDSYQVTQEVRVGWNSGDGLDVKVAAMFLYEGLNVNNTFALSPFDSRTQNYTMWTRYGTVFGELNWEPSENFTLHGGLRLNYEEKELSLFSEAFDPVFGNILFSETSKSQAEEFGVAGDITLSYLPTSDVTFYAKYARGWKGPHINGGVGNPTAGEGGTSLTDPVKPEQIDSFELGAKTVLWESRIKLNGAAFYYDYNDIQVFRLRNSSAGVPVNELINAQDADILGVELDIDIRPFEGIGPPILEGFGIFASFAWLESSYTDFVNTLQATQEVPPPGGGDPVKVVTQSTFDFSGARLINSPEFSFVGFMQWPIPTPYGSVVPRFDWSFKDEVFFSPENSELVGQSALWLMNLRLTYKAPSDNLEISGFVENLTDQSYTLDVFNLARFRRSILYAIGDPRTYGVTVRVKF